jgi:RNA polymerase sigma-70 factor, ECF subfamily
MIGPLSRRPNVLDNPQLRDLLARVALQDRSAFRRLYDLAAPHLLGVALRILINRPLAEDALQDSFVQIWRNAKTYDAARALPGAWLTSIVRYRALDLLRRAPRDVPVDEVPEAALGASPSPAEGEPRLAPCLDELGLDHRRFVTLAFVEGYSHDELSRRFRTPLGTVKSWIRRGLQQLRECLER